MIRSNRSVSGQKTRCHRWPSRPSDEHWSRATFPFELVPAIRELGTAGTPYQGHGCPGRSFLLDGMIAMELATADPSIATFHGVHSGLSMGSIYLCGSEEQKQRWLPRMAALELIGVSGSPNPVSGPERRVACRPPPAATATAGF